MTLLRNYFAIVYVLIGTSLVAGAILTWIGANSPDITDVVGLRSLSWATCVIATFEASLYNATTIAKYVNLKARVSRIVKSFGEPGKSIHALIFLDFLIVVIFIIAWGPTIKDFLANIEKHCNQVGHCAQMKTSAVFGWFSLVCFILRFVYLVVAEVSTAWMSIHVAHLYVNTHNTTILPTKKDNTAPNVPMGNVTSTLSGGQVIDKICVQCRQAQCAPKGVFCGADCITMARTGAPKLVELPPVHYMYREISELFRTKWTHSPTKPFPKRIFAVIMTEEKDRVYKIYREGVEIKCNFVTEGIEAGNQQLLWHGTTRECRVGDPGNETPCLSARCSLCSIIRFSFDMNRFGSKSGRLGTGIYTSMASSRANESCKSSIGSESRALLLNSVVVGNPYPTLASEPHLPRPPDGYDSVLGQGVPIHNNETVVYRNDAIRPAFLVLYLAPSTPSS